MKNQMLVVVLLTLAVLNGANSAADELEVVAEPIEIIESAIEPGAQGVTNRNFVTGIVGAGDRLLYRNYFTKSPLANYIQTQDITYRGNSTTRITYVSAVEVGYTQYATAYITAGGVGWSNVTIRLSTARSYGYYYSLDIWGR